MMSRKKVLSILLVAALTTANPVVAAFDDYFVDKTLRIDYHHTGDAKTELVAVDRVYEYGVWAGSLVNIVDRLNYGAYYHKIYDAATGELVYSRGFDSYFKEYQTSGPARDGVIRSFHESAIVPAPKTCALSPKRAPITGSSVLHFLLSAPRTGSAPNAKSIYSWNSCVTSSKMISRNSTGGRCS